MEELAFLTNVVHDDTLYPVPQARRAPTRPPPPFFLGGPRRRFGPVTASIETAGLRRRLDSSPRRLRRSWPRRCWLNGGPLGSFGSGRERTSELCRLPGLSPAYKLLWALR